MTAQELTKVVGRHADDLEDLRKDNAYIMQALNKSDIRISDLLIEVAMLKKDVERLQNEKRKRPMGSGKYLSFD